MSNAVKFLDHLAQLCKWIAADADARDRTREYPMEAIGKLRDLGFWRLNVPKDFGGLGYDHRVLIEAVILVAKADGSLGQLPQNHFNTIERLRLSGSETQRKKYLAAIGGGAFFGNATAEPGERYPGEAQTRLYFRDGQWRLTGRKVYCTGALLADHISVLCRDEADRGHVAIVQRSLSGVSVQDDWDGLGQRTTASGTSTFDEVPIEPIAILPQSEDPRISYRISAQSQLLHAAIDTGLAEAALEQATLLSRKVHGGRGSGGDRFVDDTLGVALVGELVLKARTARRLTESAATQLAAMDIDTPLESIIDVFQEVAMAKIASTRAAQELSNAVFDVGGSSYARQGSGLDRYWRDVRTHTLHDAVRWKPHSIGLWYIEEAVADPWSIAHPYRPLTVLKDAIGVSS